MGVDVEVFDDDAEEDVMGDEAIENPPAAFATGVPTLAPVPGLAVARMNPDGFDTESDAVGVTVVDAAPPAGATTNNGFFVSGVAGAAIATDVDGPGFAIAKTGFAPTPVPPAAAVGGGAGFAITNADAIRWVGNFSHSTLRRCAVTFHQNDDNNLRVPHRRERGRNGKKIAKRTKGTRKQQSVRILVLLSSPIGMAAVEQQGHLETAPPSSSFSATATSAPPATTQSLTTKDEGKKIAVTEFAKQRQVQQYSGGGDDDDPRGIYDEVEIEDMSFDAEKQVSVRPLTSHFLPSTRFHHTQSQSHRTAPTATGIFLPVSVRRQVRDHRT